MSGIHPPGTGPRAESARAEALRQAADVVDLFENFEAFDAFPDFLSPEDFNLFEEVPLDQWPAWCDVPLGLLFPPASQPRPDSSWAWADSIRDGAEGGESC